MATVVTLTIADADAARIVNAINAPSQLQPGAGPPLFPPNVAIGSSNAVIIKQFCVETLQQIAALREGTIGDAAIGVAGYGVPTIT
jgi:hypothetical protein